MKTYFIKNASDLQQNVSGIGSFEPGEIKEVDENGMHRLTRNSNFVEVDENGDEMPTLTEVTEAKSTRKSNKTQ